MEVISEDGEHYPMDTVERQPVFSLFLPHKRPFSYQIHMTFHDGNTYISSDPYSYEGLITEEEEKLFSKNPLYTPSFALSGVPRSKICVCPISCTISCTFSSGESNSLIRTSHTDIGVLKTFP